MYRGAVLEHLVWGNIFHKIIVARFDSGGKGKGERILYKEKIKIVKLETKLL